MKHYITAVLVWLAIAPIYAQDVLHIQGKINGVFDTKNSQVFCEFKAKLHDEKSIVPVTVIGNSFHFDIEINEPTVIVLRMDKKDMSVAEGKRTSAIGFMADTGKYDIEIDDQFIQAKLLVPKQINEDFKAFNKIISEDREKLIANAKKNMNETEINRITLSSLFDFAESNRHSYISLFALSTLLQHQPSLAPALLEMYNGYNENIKNTALGKELGNVLANKE